MHEGNFTEQIVENILRELKLYANTKPKKIQVKVGDMLHLEPESVQMHYGVLVKGTPLEGCELHLKEIKTTVRCRTCDREGRVADHHLLACNACMSRNVEIISGNEVQIESIELEES